MWIVYLHMLICVVDSDWDRRALSQAYVRSLLTLGHSVLVLCGKHRPAGKEEGQESKVEHCEHDQKRWFDASGKVEELVKEGDSSSRSRKALVCMVPVSTWNRVDNRCSWEEFSKGSLLFASDVRDFKAQLVLAVDWSGACVFERLTSTAKSLSCGLLYLNYRVFACNQSVPKSETQFYRRLESKACSMCVAVVCLCDEDKRLLQATFGEYLSDTKVYVINPPLRQDVQARSEVTGGYCFFPFSSLFPSAYVCVCVCKSLLPLFTSRSLPVVTSPTLPPALFCSVAIASLQRKTFGCLWTWCVVSASL